MKPRTGSRMNAGTRGRVAWAIAITSFVVSSVCAVGALLMAGWTNTDPLLTIIVILATAAWGGIGALIAARTGNRIGWFLLAVIALRALTLLAQSYATISFAHPDHRLPFDAYLGLLNQVSFVLMLALIVAIPLLYPTGEPRWRWVWRVYVGALVTMGIGWLFLPQRISLAVDEEVIAPPQSPLGIESLRPLLGIALSVAGFTVLACAGIAVASLVVQYRRAEGDTRQQIKWLAYVGILALAGLVGIFVALAVWGDPAPQGAPTIIASSLFAFVLLVTVFGIPAASGIAILRYRLYDLDVVVKKTLVALVLALIIGVVAIGAIALAGQVALWEGTPKSVTVAIGVILGALLVPLLRLSRRVADRLVYGKRATPYEVLASFSSRVGETYSSDDVLPRMAQILCAGTGATSARVLVRVGAGLREAASSGEPDGAEHVEPIVFQGEDVGALAVTFPANDPLDQPRTQLIKNLAAQAGPVVRNVRLIEELRASRQRLVAAQDEERRKLERNIHDGVQQQLVALAVKLKLADAMVERDPAKARETLASLQDDAGSALEDLRDLARGIYPPLLADQGLAAALTAQARKAAVPTSVAADDVGRFDRAIEAAVYFCALEALNNVAKYADASAAEIRLEQTNGKLTFSVQDDGVGFDPSETAHGSGLQGMADRLDAIGGRLRVESTLGRGATITGDVPVEAPP